MADEIDFGGKTLKNATLDAQTIAGGISGSVTNTDRYVFCQPGDNLATKYAAACALTPKDEVLGPDNRAYLIIFPGHYTFDPDTFSINTSYVDIIGLGSNRLDRGCLCAVLFQGGALNVTANDVRIKGISVGDQRIITGTSQLQYFEECIGGDWSFCRDINGAQYGAYDNHQTASYGVYINCVGGDYSFGGNIFSTYSGWPGWGFETSGAYGYYAHCVAGDYSFGGNASGSAGDYYWTSPDPFAISGTFINCKGGVGFARGPHVDGLFVDCEAGSDSFGWNVYASNGPGGTFRNCVAGDNSFGCGADGVNLASVYRFCRAGLDGFSCWTFNGLIEYCIADNNQNFNLSSNEIAANKVLFSNLNRVGT